MEDPDEDDQRRRARSFGLEHAAGSHLELRVGCTKAALPIPPPPSTVTEALDKCQTFVVLRAGRARRKDPLRDAGFGEAP